LIFFQEYQKSRAEIIKQFDEHETRKNELQKQLSNKNKFHHTEITFFSLATNPKIRAINDVTKYDSLEVLIHSSQSTKNFFL
jgi:hypothetical protein